MPARARALGARAHPARWFARRRRFDDARRGVTEAATHARWLSDRESLAHLLEPALHVALVAWLTGGPEGQATRAVVEGALAVADLEWRNVSPLGSFVFGVATELDFVDQAVLEWVTRAILEEALSGSGNAAGAMSNHHQAIARRRRKAFVARFRAGAPTVTQIVEAGFAPPAVSYGLTGGSWWWVVWPLLSFLRCLMRGDE